MSRAKTRVAAAAKVKATPDPLQWIEMPIYASDRAKLVEIAELFNGHVSVETIAAGVFRDGMNLAGKIVTDDSDAAEELLCLVQMLPSASALRALGKGQPAE